MYTKSIRIKTIIASAKARAKFHWLKRTVKNYRSDKCLIWPFTVKKNGYGMCRFDGKLVYAHRLAFYFAYGHWPTPVGRHTCDTPTCINPRHVVEGTQADNVADTIVRDRACRGERSAFSKLTDKAVRKMRKEYRPYVNGAKVLGKKYGVHGVTALKAIKRITWKHVT